MEPLLKVGILSDTQCNPERDDWGVYNLELALKQLSDEKIGMLFTGGDLTEVGDPAVYPLYRELMNRYFKENPPEELHCIGNHDYGWSKDWNKRLRNYDTFCDGLGQSHDNPCWKRVKGFNFIVLHSAPDGVNYDEEPLKKLEDLLTRFSAEEPGKPLFLYTHRAPDRTVVSSDQNCEADKTLRRLLNKFPCVVSFSGHHHCPLEDERSIWQEEFTAVATADLSYGAIPEQAVNLCGPILPFGREVTEMIVMEIFPDKIVLHRRNVTENREIKPDRVWQIPLPYCRETARYTEARSSAAAPQFAPGTRLLTRYDYGYYYLIFEGAKHEDFTHFYEVEIAAEGKEPERFLYVANFYRLQRNQNVREVFKLPGEALEGGKRYRIRVYPVETFGKKGEFIETELNIPADRTVRSAKAVYPQE